MNKHNLDMPYVTGANIADANGDETVHVTWDCRGDVNVMVIDTNGDAVLDMSGICALRAVLDKAEAAYWERTDPIGGGINEACEPSSRDRLFYKPQSHTLPNGDVRHFSPPSPPFEPCPDVGTHIRGDMGGKVVKATHPAAVQGTMSAPLEMKNIPSTAEAIAEEMKRLAKMPKVGAAEPIKDIPLPPLEWHRVSAPPPSDGIAGRERCISVGDRIRWARRKAKMTLEDTANALGVSIPHASDIERHNAQPTDEQLAKLATLFDVSVEELKGDP